MPETLRSSVEVQDEAGRTWEVRQGDPGWLSVYYLSKLGYGWYILPSLILAGAVDAAPETEGHLLSLGTPNGNEVRNQYVTLLGELVKLGG